MVLAPCARLHSTSGGSSDTELKELAVSPTHLPPALRAVTLVTPVANMPRASRNSRGEKLGGWARTGWEQERFTKTAATVVRWRAAKQVGGPAGMPPLSAPARPRAVAGVPRHRPGGRGGAPRCAGGAAGGRLGWAAARAAARPVASGRRPRGAEGGAGGWRPTEEAEVQRRLLAADEFGQRLAGAGAMGPAQRAVAGIHPQLAQARLADERDVARRGRTQAAPVLRVAALPGIAGVAHAAQDFFDAARQHVEARLGNGAVERQVEAAQLDGAGHAQPVAQAGQRELAPVVDGRHPRRSLRPQQRE